MGTIKLTPSAQYAVTLRLEYPHQPGWIARIAAAIGDAGGAIEAIDLIEIRDGRSVRDYTVECASSEQAEEVVRAVRALPGLKLHGMSDDTFRMHLGGKLEIRSRVPLETRSDLSRAYTPGVGRVCMAIHNEPRLSHALTVRKNCIAVVSDGSAVLGLGNIGPEAAMPVMEGKAILFKEFGGVDAVPLCVRTQDTGQIIDFCRWAAASFGGINLEDISAPRCFVIEDTLKRELDIPVFHDDQHGTAVVVLAGLMNALRISGRRPADLKVVVAGAGASGIACSRTLHEYGVGRIVICDRKGAIWNGRDIGDNPAKQWAAENTNQDREQGALKEVIAGADMFLGLSGPGLLEREDIERMNPRPIVFAMSNPTPEVMPEAISDLVSVMATGRSDYPNQINNVLAFPGIFRGALDAHASDINEPMKQAAAEAIAGVVTDAELSPDYIIPSVFNRKVARQVSAVVARSARATHVARRVRFANGLHRP
jgi:malate dehydrogenase (oxaloacetate-decarboxylating)